MRRGRGRQKSILEILKNSPISWEEFYEENGKDFSNKEWCLKFSDWMDSVSKYRKQMGWRYRKKVRKL